MCHLGYEALLKEVVYWRQEVRFYSLSTLPGPSLLPNLYKRVSSHTFLLPPQAAPGSRHTCHDGLFSQTESQNKLSCHLSRFLVSDQFSNTDTGAGEWGPCCDNHGRVVGKAFGQILCLNNLEEQNDVNRA